LLENPKGTFFENGKAQPTPTLQALLKVLSTEIGKLPNSLLIEGHTDSKPFSDSQTYGNWELSTDRANISRRLMEGSGLRPDQVVQVRGYADRSLLKPLQPDDASNRRITMIVQNTEMPVAQPAFVSNGSLPKAGDLSPAAAPIAKPAPATAKESKPEK
jgi:chemotaxis protein MotB